MGKLKSVEELFEGRHFNREVIILCVRWYLRCKLSLRDLVEMMAERGLSMARRNMGWVQRYAPEFEKRWRRSALQSASHRVSTGPPSRFKASGDTCTICAGARKHTGCSFSGAQLNPSQ